MGADTVVRARIDLATKEQAAATLADMGLSLSDFIRMALVRVARDKAVPFAVEAPDVLTAKTLRAAERGEDLHAASDAADLFEKLGI